ncbi:hypothetical protein ACFYTS_36520 [Nocardia sp. NPDC004151]
MSSQRLPLGVISQRDRLPARGDLEAAIGQPSTRRLDTVERKSA